MYFKESAVPVGFLVFPELNVCGFFLMKLCQLKYVSKIISTRSLWSFFLNLRICTDLCKSEPSCHYFGQGHLVLS